MAAPRLLPDKATLEKHRRDGMTYAEIGARYGVTEQAVWGRLKHDGVRMAKRADHSELIPWKVSKEHANAFPILMLRTLSRQRQGFDNPPEREAMLKNWLAKLEEQNAVVCYDPAMWPNPASPRLGGWFYAKRRKADGDNLIRYTVPGKGLPKR